jgi:hypothetical protein
VFNIVKNVCSSKSNVKDGKFMKIKNKWFVGFGVLLVFGFLFTACSNDSNDDDPYHGTWVGTNNGSTVKIVASSGSYKQYLDDNEVSRGTYTYSGNNVTGKTTEVNYGGVWTAYASLPDEYKSYVPETTQVTINGNSFTANGVTFTKQ